ncbi:MAG: sugar phosphate isomerase/epimerase [Chloroflexi bacterium]|nr:sugar phosphate isomerase/epimerase [Chloroflexota bacterium]
MQLGFVSAILPDRSLEQVLRFAGVECFDCVELMCWPVGKADRRYAGVTHIDVAGITAESAAHVKELCAETGVRISALGYYPNLLSPVRAEAEAGLVHLKRVIDAAPLVGVNLVTSFIGRDWTRSVDENWPQFLATWPPLVRYAAERGVRIAIENCPMLFTRDEWPGGKNMANTPAVWRRMFDAIPENLGLNYDPSHFIWQHMDYIKPLPEFAGRIWHIHAKDVRLDRKRLDEVGILAEPLQYHTPKLPGLGEIDWGRFFSALSDTGYQGPVCVEVEDRAYEGTLASREQALCQSRDYLRQYMGRER